MQFKIALGNFLIAYSEALDLICPALVDHHKDVAYWAGLMGSQLGLGQDRLRLLVQSALLHDIGIFTVKERLDSISFEFEMENAHAQVGALLLEYAPHFKAHAQIIRHHHDIFEAMDPSAPIPLESQIIFLVDRVSVLIDKKKRILAQRRPIRAMLREQRGKRFNPQLVDLFEKNLYQEHFWMDIQNRRDEVIRSYLGEDDLIMDQESLESFGKLFIRAIDFRSRHTAAHSVAVSKVVEQLTGMMGFADEDRRMLTLSGYFHDIGKVVIPSEILDKPGVVTWDEMETIREHPYYTQRILKELKGLGRYAEIAAQHHERLDGSGYPFHLKGEDLHPESEILTIADIFTALVETRSYREGLSQAETFSILDSYERSRTLNTAIIGLVKRNYHDLRALIKQSYAEVFEEYHIFDERVREYNL